MKKVDSLLPGPVGLSSTSGPTVSHGSRALGISWMFGTFLLESQIWDIGRQYNAGPLC